MPDEKEFAKHKLFILDKIEHFKQQDSQLEQRVRQLEIDYARDINNVQQQIAVINEATKSFPTKEQVEGRLQNLEKVGVEGLPAKVESLQQYQQRMEGKMMAYSSGIAFLVSLASIILYIIFL